MQTTNVKFLDLLPLPWARDVSPRSRDWATVNKRHTAGWAGSVFRSHALPEIKE